METIRNQKEALQLENGTYKIGEINGMRYYELVEILGEPTFNEESFDGKIQVEWVVDYQGSIFTIYDWKTFDREYTLESLRSWSIGGIAEDVFLMREFKNEIEE